MILTTGTGSGLGKYLHEQLGGAGFTRSTGPGELRRLKREGVGAIIHCAFNSARTVTGAALYGYAEDNVLFTEVLTGIPHSKFVYISTVDVYPKSGGGHTEDAEIDAGSVEGLYGITKLISESIVRARSENYLILRASALLGKYSRENSLLRMLGGDCTLTLSGESSFNYVLHSDVHDFIAYALDHDLKGVYNVVSSENITLQRVAAMSGNNVKFGQYRYDTGNIGNDKIVSVFPALSKTSEDAVSRFMAERSNG